MENFLFFLYYQDTLNQIRLKIQNPFHLEFYKFLLIYLFKHLDNHATFQFHHKVTFETLSDHIN